MRVKDFHNLSASIEADCRAAIRTLSSQHVLKDVYVFVIQFDPLYGSLSASLNTMRTYEDLLQREQLHDSDLGQDDSLYGFQGVKYCVDEFGYFDFVKFSTHTEALCELYRSALSRADRTSKSSREKLLSKLTISDDYVEVPKSQLKGFLLGLLNATTRRNEDYESCHEDGKQAVIRAIRQLSPDFSQLDTTEDFIAFASCYPDDEEEEKRLMLQTVPPALFDQLFPGFGLFEKLISRVQQVDHQQQVNFWLRTLSDWLLKRESRSVIELKRCRKKPSDVETQLTNFGRQAVPSIVDHLEHFVFAPQLSKEKPESGRNSAFTDEHDLCLTLSQCLRTIKESDAESVERLHSLLQQLFSLEYEKGLIGLNQISLARALNALDNRRFAEDSEIGGSDNHLLNWQAFGLSRPT